MDGLKKSKSQHHLKQKYLRLFHAAQLNALESACHEYSIVLVVEHLLWSSSAAIETEMALRRSRKACQAPLIGCSIHATMVHLHNTYFPSPTRVVDMWLE